LRKIELKETCWEKDRGTETKKRVSCLLGSWKFSSFLFLLCSVGRPWALCSPCHSWILSSPAPASWD
jgi:hypothetical protein